MKFYGIESVNPLQIGTPSNDNALTNLLAWDPNDGKVKYRNVSSISGGGGSGSQTLSEVLQTGNNTGTYSLKFLDNNSEIYPIIGGTFFSGWTSSMSSVIAITSSAFVFNPRIEEVAPGINALRSTIGAVVFHPESNSGLSKSAWMCSQNGSATIKNCLNMNPTNFTVCSNGLVSSSNLQVDSAVVSFSSNSGNKNIAFYGSGQSPLISMSAYETSTHSTCLQMSDTTLSLCAYSSTTSLGNCLIIGSNCIDINGVCGVDGQVISINTTGQLCWQTPITGSGGGGSTILNLNEIGFGTGTGITSSSAFTFNNSYKSFISSDSSSIDITSCNSVIVGGCCNTLQCNSCQSSIVGGCCNIISCYSCDSTIVASKYSKIYCQSYQSTIVGGRCNKVCYTAWGSSINGGWCNTIVSSNYSMISGGACNFICNSGSSPLLGGYRNCILNSLCSAVISGVCNKVYYQVNNSSILVGYCNTLQCDACNSSIVGGDSNTLQCDSNQSTIVGGRHNTLQCGSCYSSIIVGCCNTLQCASNYSSIVGGFCNTLQCNSKYSSILGGFCNTIQSYSNQSSIVGGNCNILQCGSCNSAIIGGSNLSLCNECNIVYVPELKVATASNDDLLTKVLVWDDSSTMRMKWRDVSTIGGGISLPTNYIGFGNGSTIISDASFIFNCGLKSFQSSPGACLNSCYSSVIGGRYQISYDTLDSSIIGGNNNTMCYQSAGSAIMGGSHNKVCYKSYRSVIIGGTYNCIQKYSSGGVILGGGNNLICNHNNNNSIIGGYGNQVFTDPAYGSLQVSESSIIGGGGNKIYDCKGTCTCAAAIIGSCGSTLRASNNSVIVGGNGIVLESCSCVMATDKIVTKFPAGSCCGSPPLLGSTFRVGDIFDMGVSTYLPANQCFLRVEIGGSYFKIPLF